MILLKIIAIVNIPLNITCQTVKKGDLVLDTIMLLAFKTIVVTFSEFCDSWKHCIWSKHLGCIHEEIYGIQSWKGFEVNGKSVWGLFKNSVLWK